MFFIYIYHFVIVIVHTVNLICCSIWYRQHLFHVLEEKSLLFCLFHILPVKLNVPASRQTDHISLCPCLYMIYLITWSKHRLLSVHWGAEKWGHCWRSNRGKWEKQMIFPPPAANSRKKQVSDVMFAISQLVTESGWFYENNRENKL